MLSIRGDSVELDYDSYLESRLSRPIVRAPVTHDETSLAVERPLSRPRLALEDSADDSSSPSPLLLPFHEAVNLAKRLLSSRTFNEIGAYTAGLLAAVVKALPSSSPIASFLTIPNAFRLRKSVFNVSLATRWLQTGSTKALIGAVGSSMGIKLSLLLTPIITLAQQLVVSAAADLIEEGLNRVIDALVEAVGAKPSAKTLPKYIVAITVSVIAAVAMTGVTAGPNTLTLIFMIVVHFRRRLLGWWESVKLLTVFNVVHESVAAVVGAVEVASNTLALRAFGGGGEGSAAVANTILAVERIDLSSRADYIEKSVVPKLVDSGTLSREQVESIKKNLHGARNVTDPALRMATRDVSDDAARTVEMRARVESAENMIHDAIVKSNEAAQARANLMQKELQRSREREAAADAEEERTLRMTQDAVRKFYEDMQGRLAIGESMNPLMFSGTPVSTEMPGIVAALSKLHTETLELKDRREEAKKLVSEAAAEQRKVESTLSQLTKSVISAVYKTGYDGPPLERAPGQSVHDHAVGLLQRVESTADVFKSLAKALSEGKSVDAQRVFLGSQGPTTMEELSMDEEQRKNHLLRKANGLIRDINSISEGVSDLVNARVHFVDVVNSLQEAVNPLNPSVVSKDASDEEIRTAAMKAISEEAKIATSVKNYEDGLDKVLTAFMNVGSDQSSESSWFNFFSSDASEAYDEFEKIVKEHLELDSESATKLFKTLRWRSAFMSIEAAMGRKVESRELVDFLNGLSREYFLSSKQYADLRTLIEGGSSDDIIASMDDDHAIPNFKRLFLALKRDQGDGNGDVAAVDNLSSYLGRLANSTENMVRRTRKKTDEFWKANGGNSMLSTQAQMAGIVKKVITKTGIYSMDYADTIRGDLERVRDQISSQLVDKTAPGSIAALKKEIEDKISNIESIQRSIENRKDEEALRSILSDGEKNIKEKVSTKIKELFDEKKRALVPSKDLSSFASRVKEIANSEELNSLNEEIRTKLENVKSLLGSDKEKESIIANFIGTSPVPAKRSKLDAEMLSGPIIPTAKDDPLRFEESDLVAIKPSDLRRMTKGQIDDVINALDLLNDIVSKPGYRAVGAIKMAVEGTKVEEPGWFSSAPSMINRLMSMIPIKSSEVKVSNSDRIYGTFTERGRDSSWIPDALKKEDTIDAMHVLNVIMRETGHNQSDKVIPKKESGLVQSVFSNLVKAPADIGSAIMANIWRPSEGPRDELLKAQKAAEKAMKEAGVLDP